MKIYRIPNGTEIYPFLFSYEEWAIVAGAWKILHWDARARTYSIGPWYFREDEILDNKIRTRQLDTPLISSDMYCIKVLNQSSQWNAFVVAKSAVELVEE